MAVRWKYLQNKISVLRWYLYIDDEILKGWGHGDEPVKLEPAE